jgi:hypothetical protein
MSDLGDDLRSTIEGAATPVSWHEVARRDGRDRPRRAAPWRTFATGVAVTALLLVGLVVVTNLGDDDPRPTRRIAAPTVAVGDIDLAVLSTSFDSDGARGPIDPSVVDTVRTLPGIAGAQGAMQRFVDVVRTTDTFDSRLPASERSAIAISWEQGAPLVFAAGGPPQQSNEIAINQSLAARYGVGVGDSLVVSTGNGFTGATPVQSNGSVVMGQPSSAPPARVVGVFTLAGGDVDDVNLVVMRAEDLGTITRNPQFDRIDIVADKSVATDELLDRVSAALPNGTMAVPPSVVGFGDQLRSELEIQRAYHLFLNPDHDRANAATLDPATGAGAETNLNTFNQNLESIKQAEFRVGRVAFVNQTTALVTVRLYFGGSAWNGVPDPTTQVAQLVDGAWRVSQSCEYAAAGHVACVEGGGPDPSAFTAPPNGWNAPDSVPGLADSFRVLADPTSTAAARSAVVDRSGLLEAAIANGVQADASRTNVSFVVSGARLVDATHAQILYSLIADGEPHLETPYPFVGNAVLVDGTWRVASRYACGLAALATLSCPAAAALPTTTTSAPASTSTSVPVTTVPRESVTPTTGVPTTITEPDGPSTTTTTP